MLGHEVKRSEDFGAASESPRERCLAAARWADVMLLLVGGKYGQRQQSGLSATHEEYREARGRVPVLAFVQGGVAREAEQQVFLDEVRNWAGGLYTENFESADRLRDLVVRRLHEFEVSRGAGAADEREMLTRAKVIEPSDREHGDGSLTLIVAGGPRREILRPSEIEDPALERAIKREALLGDFAILDPEGATSTRIAGGALMLVQQRHIVRIDPLGTVRLTWPARPTSPRLAGISLAIIEEDLREGLQRALRLAAWILDHVDDVRRLSHVVPIVALRGGAFGWQSRAEHTLSPNQVTIRMGGGDPITVQLAPALRHRASMTQEVETMAQDFTVLLRREMKSGF